MAEREPLIPGGPACASGLQSGSEALGRLIATSGADAPDDAVMGSGEAHQNQMMQYLNSKELQAGFQRVVFEMLIAKQAERANVSGQGR